MNTSLQEETYILLPNVADLGSSGESHAGGLKNLRSVMTTPIIAPAGAYGVIYLDNGSDQPAFTMHDLDYLTLVSTQVAAILEHIG